MYMLYSLEITRWLEVIDWEGYSVSCFEVPCHKFPIVVLENLSRCLGSNLGRPNIRLEYYPVHREL
jgi:hypothetical protein